MNTFHNGLERHFDEQLAVRERQLCEMLARTELAWAAQRACGEVGDFKDIAARELDAVVDAAQAERAAFELEQVLHARARLHDHSFGRCRDCDDDIPLQRLLALPATTLCAHCQSAHERAAGAHGPH